MSIALIGGLFFYFSPSEDVAVFSRYNEFVESARVKIGQDENKAEQLNGNKKKTRRLPSSSPDENQSGQLDRPVRPATKFSHSVKKINVSKLDLADRLESKIQVQGKKYLVVNNLMAVKKEDLGPGPFGQWEEFAGYYLIKKSIKDSVDSNAKTVLYNEDSGGIAIFMGVLKIQFFDYADNDKLKEIMTRIYADSIRMELIEERENINLAFYQFENYEQTMSVYHLLQTEELKKIIKRTTIDLIQWKRLPK